MQMDYIKRRIFLGGNTISEGFFPFFFSSISQINQVTRSWAALPCSDVMQGQLRKLAANS